MYGAAREKSEHALEVFHVCDTCQGELTFYSFVTNGQQSKTVCQNCAFNIAHDPARAMQSAIRYIPQSAEILQAIDVQLK